MEKRYVELDSLRGLAALTVLIGHLYAVFQETPLMTYIFRLGFLRWLVASGEAVILFFILSGFVLSLPFFKNKPFNYFSYLTKRFCRIYLPYIIAVLFAGTLMVSFYSGEIRHASNWFNYSWSKDLSFQVIADHFLLIGTFASNIDNVVWSLVHEMRISIIFPFLMYFIIKYNWKVGLLFAFSLSFISVFYFNLTNPVDSYSTEVYKTIHYTAMFIIGSLLAKHRNNLTVKVGLLSRRNKIILFGTGLFFYYYVRPSYVLGAIVPLPGYTKMVIDNWFLTLGACVIIVFALSSGKFSLFLRNRIVNFLGKISYSLYLIHLPIILVMVHLLSEKLPLWLICILSVPLVIFGSNLMYRYIEEPSIKIGRTLAGLISRKSSKELEKTA